MIEIAAVLAATKTITDIAKSLSDTSAKIQVEEVKVALTNAVIDLQTQLLSIQADYQGILSLNEQLRQQLVEKENWERKASNYHLESLGGAAFVYALNSSSDTNEPPHWICPNCYEESRKSILFKSGTRREYKCPNCEVVISTERFP